MAKDIRFMQNGVVQFDEASIIFRNFSGTASKYNREGDRNFAIVIENEEDAQRLSDNGWNVKVKEREDGTLDMHLPVKIKFNERGPAVYLKSGAGDPIRLDEDSVGCLDNIDILSVDVDVRPFDWEVNGKTGRAAYLQCLFVTQNVTDRFRDRYSKPQDEDEPF